MPVAHALQVAHHIVEHAVAQGSHLVPVRGIQRLVAVEVLRRHPRFLLIVLPEAPLYRNFGSCGRTACEHIIGPGPGGGTPVWCPSAGFARTEGNHIGCPLRWSISWGL